MQSEGVELLTSICSDHKWGGVVWWTSRNEWVEYVQSIVKL